MILLMLRIEFAVIILLPKIQRVKLKLLKLVKT